MNIDRATAIQARGRSAAATHKGRVRRVVSCPLCKEPAVAVYRSEVFLPGDNPDNSTKGWACGCEKCDHLFFVSNAEMAANAAMSDRRLEKTMKTSVNDYLNLQAKLMSGTASGSLRQDCSTATMCQSCHKRPATPDHTCPYKEDINNDSETMCNCCDACRHECCMDI